jgi:hypothetical protein
MPVNPTDQPRRVAVYVRVCSLNQGQDSEARLRPLREYAQRRGFIMVEEYVETGLRNL